VQTKKSGTPAQSLCLSCGLCCNGVLFADVRLQAGDNPEDLRRAGLPVRVVGGKALFAQPCAALHGCRCGIYADRPRYCRQFECLLLKRASAGEVSYERALALISKTRAHVQKVERLLAKLGDHDERLPLRRRFQRQERRLQQSVDKQAAGVFSDLTLAFQDLNLLLKEHFYPG
jgi:Fe-S-cluster containining protein